MDYKPGYTEGGYSFVGGDPSNQTNWKQVGSVEDGYRFKGGDPSAKESWEEYKDPDMSALKGHVEENLKVHQTIAKAKGQDATPAEGFFDSLEAGYQMSVSGLIQRGKLPDKVMPEDAPFMARIASQVGQLAGDVPAMIAGAYAGAEAGGAVGLTTGAVIGSVVPGPGTVAGAAAGGGIGAVAGGGAGAFAVPGVMRKALMDHYEKGDIQDSRDFWERSSSLFLTALKEGTVGAATSLVGGKVTESVAKAGMSAISKAVLPPAAELATMVTVGKGMEGQLPNAQDFMDGAVLLAGMHGAVKVAGKMRSVYAETGKTPVQVGELMNDHPTIQQELLADNIEMPKAMEKYVERPEVKGISDLPKFDRTKLEEGVQVKSGEVVHFDGKDGVIKTPEGEMVHFGAGSVKENFKVGDTVDFQTGLKESAEVVFGGREKKVEVPAEETIVSKEDGSVEVKTTDGGTRPPTPEELILGQVGERQPRKSSDFSFDKLYTNLVDKFDPIKVAVEKLKPNEKLPTSENPYDLARMANDYKAKVKHVFDRGMIDYETLKTTGKSFKQIIEPFAGDAKAVDGLKAFMISARALEIEGRGIKSGFDLNAAREVMAKGEAKYGKAAQELVDFQNGALQYAKDAGLISDKALNNMKELGKSYVSFSRIIEPEDIGGRTPGKSKSLKSLKGSERMIQDPFKSMIENTESLFRAAEANRSMKAMVELVKDDANQELITKVKTKMKPIEVSESEVAKFLKDQGIHESVDPEAFNIFRPMEKRNLGPNEFDVMIDGKRQVFETEPELADAFKRLGNNTGSMNAAVKMFNGVTALKKLGITFTPDFQMKNLFRDQLTAGVFTEGGSIPFKDVFYAMGDIVAKNDTYYNWLKAGGAGGAFIELNTEYLNKDLLNVSKETGIGSKVFNLVKKPAEYLALAGTIAEEGTRLAEFKRVSKGATEGADLFKGGMASREVTVDFQRIGAKMSALNAITAFQNVAIQGLDRTGRAIKADPAGVTAKGLMYLTAPSLLLWWANKDDERYKEIPRWQKDLFWIIPTNDWQKAKDAAETDGLPKHLVRQAKDGSFEINRGHIYRLPKPQELGLIFGTIPERMAEKFFTDNPRAMKDFGETVGGLVTPNFIPDAVLPLVEQGVNKNLFTSAPLVSPQMEERLPQLQYSEYTSSTAKTLGKLIGQIPLAKDIGPESTKLESPAVVDNYIKSWTGALGSYVVEVLDKSLEKSGVVPDPNKPTKTLSDIPFIKAFTVRYPSASPQSITDFYARSREANKVFNSINFLKKQGDMEGMQAIMNNPEYQEVMVRTNEIKSALGAMTDAVHKIYANKEMNKDEKRQQIDTIYYMMSETAQRGNQFMDEFAEMTKKNKK